MCIKPNINEEPITATVNPCRSKTPKTIPELKALAMETKKNTEDALKQMKDELRRSSGKIVAGDNLAVPQYRNEYSLDPKNIVVRLEEEEENSITSDTVSSE